MDLSFGYRLKGLMIGVAAVSLAAYAWWGGALKIPPRTIGVYNVQSGQPVLGVQLRSTDNDGNVIKLGMTDVKGHLLVRDLPDAIFRRATIDSRDYVVVTEPGEASPSLSVDLPIFVRFNR